DSYCMKDVTLDNLPKALRATAEGHAWIDPAIARFVLQQVRKHQPQSRVAIGRKTVTINAVDPDYGKMIQTCPLTERELEILELIVQGESNAAIGEKLYITVGTVKTHVRNLLNKLCADDRTQAAVQALRCGLIA
ncbi:MAG TPA: response regulator transcription factor, partial [Candidatus Caenarcaniphilales bacterium]